MGNLYKKLKKEVMYFDFVNNGWEREKVVGTIMLFMVLIFEDSCSCSGVSLDQGGGASFGY